MVEARSINPGFKKPSFSETEIKHILVAIIVLAVAFTMIYSRKNDDLFSDDEIVNMLCWFGISLLLVVCSFMFHELGHKFVAQKYGAWAEFRAWGGGLLLALVSGFLGFLFAAPGAVYIQGRIDDEANGKISIAGPAVNFVIAAIALVFVIVLPITNMTEYYIWIIFDLLFFLNAFLGTFNMIPVPPLDGYKVMRWNLVVWIAGIAIGIFFLLVAYDVIPLINR